ASGGPPLRLGALADALPGTLGRAPRSVALRPPRPPVDTPDRGLPDRGGASATAPAGQSAHATAARLSGDRADPLPPGQRKTHPRRPARPRPAAQSRQPLRP